MGRVLAAKITVEASPGSVGKLSMAVSARWAPRHATRWHSGHDRPARTVPERPDHRGLAAPRAGGCGAGDHDPLVAGEVLPAHEDLPAPGAKAAADGSRGQRVACERRQHPLAALLVGQPTAGVTAVPQAAGLLVRRRPGLHSPKSMPSSTLEVKYA